MTVALELGGNLRLVFLPRINYRIASWASNGPTDGAVVTDLNLSPTAPMADRVATPTMGVDFLGLSPVLICAVYLPPLDVAKSDLFIIRAVHSRLCLIQNYHCVLV